MFRRRVMGRVQKAGLSAYGAGDGIRTRDINLGKVALYQLSYSRSERRKPHSPMSLL